MSVLNDSLQASSQGRREQLMTKLFLDLQIARFNELYYHRRADKMRWWSTSANIVSALAASAVLARLLSNGLGVAWLWQLLTGLAAVTAALSPVLQLDAKATQFEKAALGHSIVHNQIKELLHDLKISKLDESHLARSKEIAAFRGALAGLDESPQEDVIEKSWNQTMEELPSQNAWNLV